MEPFCFPQRRTVAQMMTTPPSGGVPNATQVAVNEDWMKVLDNFIDIDNAGHNEDENVHGTDMSSGSEYPRNQPGNQVFHEAQTSASSHTRSALSHHTPTPNPISAQDNHEVNNNNNTNNNSNNNNNNAPRSDENYNSDSEEAKAQARSERKRFREKQRRSDVNSQFTALTSLLRRVEAEDLESDISDDEDSPGNSVPPAKKRKRGSALLGFGPGSSTPSNRVDLIARTIAVLDRLHELSGRRRKECKDLRKTLRKLGNVTASPDAGIINNPNESVDVDKGIVPSVTHSAMGVLNPNANAMGSQCLNTPNGAMVMMPSLTQGVGNINMNNQQQSTNQNDPNKPVMMMVPMMIPQNPVSQGSTNPTMSSFPMQFMPQPLYPQNFMQPTPMTHQQQQQQQHQQDHLNTNTSTGTNQFLSNTNINGFHNANTVNMHMQQMQVPTSTNPQMVHGTSRKSQDASCTSTSCTTPSCDSSTNVNVVNTCNANNVVTSSDTHAQHSSNTSQQQNLMWVDPSSSQNFHSQQQSSNLRHSNTSIGNSHSQSQHSARDGHGRTAQQQHHSTSQTTSSLTGSFGSSSGNSRDGGSGQSAYDGNLAHCA